MNGSQLLLGLDLGVTSVGWALLRQFAGDEARTEIVVTGVRIFPATIEDKTATPKNLKRRTARGARRVLRRRRQRRQAIKKLLTASGLLPEINADGETALGKLGDPYQLRARGSMERLEQHEIGRALFHLIQRRGFKSNRKSEKSKDDGVVYEGIAKIREEMSNSEFITLGALLNSKEKKRKHYTHRSMIEDEFDQIWATQAAHYPEILTPELCESIRHAAFYQRPICSQRGLIGNCTFEPGKKRCDMARQDAQRMRYWQDINNLKLQDVKTLDWIELTAEQKFRLAGALEKLKKVEFTEADLRKALKIGDNLRINLEKKIKGNTTAFKFTRAIGSKWDEMSPDDQELLTTDLIRIEDERSLENRLREHWKFTDAEIDKLLNKTDLEPGHYRCSLKAIRKILPKMIEGLRYDEAAAAVYGDHRGVAPSGDFDQLVPPPQLRNPIVKKALGEMRKVVNAIIREYGKPDQIRLEMARDLKLTKMQKERATAQIKKNEAANKEAVDFYVNLHGIDPDAISGSDKLKYRLAKEANWTSPYSGEPIPPEDLMSDQWHIDHIIPYRRSFDDSYMNKTVCSSAENNDKLNRTPFEWIGTDEKKWYEFGLRVDGFPFGKKRKFEQKEVDESKMVNRMLSDTRYICREARAYLRQLYPAHPDENKYVQVIAGGATSKLRYVWGINAILADGDIEYKNRWDHRHHAIDAIVIALTDRALFQRISRLAARNEEFHRKELKGIEMPWEGFLDDVKTAMDSLVVSHAPTRRIRGQLLEETAYGATSVPGVYVAKKPVTSLTKPGIENIIDPVIKEIVKLRLAHFDGDLKKAFAESLYHKDGRTPIRNVRLHVTMSPETLVGIKDKAGKEYKYYPLAGNHHVDIYENSEGERKAVLVPRFYAAQRNWQPNDLGSEWNKLFALHANDYVEFRGDDGELRVLRVQKMSGGGQVVIIARPLNDARTEYVSGVVQQLQAHLKKVTHKLQVDPLGHLFTTAGS
ncbi:MAG: type II CRISPR RNA-guided endonuclease Cas9 [Pyrinomonadaceae bacterium]|nr:type II CRISPR RNA-guided endonuclease Cas9 [Pyrinomonadaceae bacterium]